MSQPRLVFPLCWLTPRTQMMDQCSCQLPSQGWNNSDPCPITPLTFIRTSRHDRPPPKGRWKTGLCFCRYNIVLLQHFHVHRWHIKSHHSQTDRRTSFVSLCLLSDETQKLLKDLANRKPLQVPNIYHHLPHLLNNEGSLHPAVQVGVGRTGGKKCARTLHSVQK